MIDINSNGGLSNEELISFEIRNNVKLPSDYRKFILDSNGGTPVSNVFEENRSIGIDTFLSLQQLEKLKNQFGERFPFSAWPFAEAAGGNYICLVIGNKSGIYFWDHELESSEGCSATWDNMILVAESFNDFIKLLRKFDLANVDLDPKDVISVWVDPDFKPEFD